MSIVRKIEPHVPEAETSLAGVVDSECTYEIAEGTLILRTTTHDTIHLTREAAKILKNIIDKEFLTID